VDAIRGLVQEAPDLTTAAPPEEPVASPDPWAVPLAAASASRLPETLAALRYRDFRLLLAGLFFALSGWWMMVVAQGWLVLELTDSASAVALVGSMLSIPFLVLGPFSGVAADRLYRKYLLVTTRSAVAALMLLEGVLILGGWIEVWQMVVLALLAGCAFAMDIPGRQSLIPDTVHESVVANAVALNVSVFSMTTIAGPIVGAVVLAIFGAGGCFVANGIGNAVLALAILFMRIPRRQRSGRWNVAGDFISGLRYVRNQRVVLLLLMVALVVTLLARNWQQLAPVFVRDVYGSGEGGLGLLYTAAGGGAVAGALLLVGLSGVRRRAPIFGVAIALAFAAIGGFALSESLYVASAFVLLTGLGLQVTETLTQTVVLVETPEEYRGRVMSLVSLLWGVQPLGVLASGVAADVWNPQLAIGAGAAVGAVALGALYLRTRPLWATF
jgi:MFS family permease